MNTRDPASTDGAGNTGSTGEEVRPRIRRTHLALFVKDPFASASWYEEVLGMQVTARGARWVFLSFGQKHHDIALIQVDEPEAATRGTAPAGRIQRAQQRLGPAAAVSGRLRHIHSIHPHSRKRSP